MKSVLKNIFTICLVVILPNLAMADSRKTIEVFQEFLKEYKKIDDQEKARQQFQPSSGSSTTRNLSTSGNTSSIQWPVRGGIEDWGFARPTGCQSGDNYLIPLGKKMNQFSNWESTSYGRLRPSPNEFSTGKTSRFISEVKRNPSSLEALKGDIALLDTEVKKLDEEATSYIQLSSTSYQTGKQVMDALRRFEIAGKNCGNMVGAANSILCGLQSKALLITVNYEHAVQIACHLGLNTPSNQIANATSNPSISSDDSNSSNNTSSAIAQSRAQFSSPSNSEPKVEDSHNPSEQVAIYASQNLSAYDKKYEGIGKKHNANAEASRCLKFIPHKKQIFNECDYMVEALFCAINPDPNSTSHAFEMAPYFNCDTNSIGMWPVKAKSPLMGRFSADNVALFACRKPSYPGAKFNRDSKSFSGRCSEY